MEVSSLKNPIHYHETILEEEEVGAENSATPLKTVERTLPSEQPLQTLITTQSSELGDDKNDQSASIVTRFLNWVRWSNKNQNAPEIVEGFQSEETIAIDTRPKIAAPESLPAHLRNMKLPSKKNEVQLLSDQQIHDILTNLSTKTIYRVMAIVLQNQRQIEQDAGLLGMDTFLNFQNQQKMKHKMIQEIKKALESDEKMGEFFRKVQYGAFVVGIAAAIVSAIGTGGVSAFAASIFGPTLGAAFATALSILPYAAGLTGALSVAGSDYFDVKSDERTVEFKSHQHYYKVLERIVDECNENFNSWSNSQGNTEEKLIKHIKKLLKTAETLISNH